MDSQLCVTVKGCVRLFVLFVRVFFFLGGGFRYIYIFFLGVFFFFFFFFFLSFFANTRENYITNIKINVLFGLIRSWKIT